jgi:hypothetical protein
VPVRNRVRLLPWRRRWTPSMPANGINRGPFAVPVLAAIADLSNQPAGAVDAPAIGPGVPQLVGRIRVGETVLADHRGGRDRAGRRSPTCRPARHDTTQSKHPEEVRRGCRDDPGQRRRVRVAQEPRRRRLRLVDYLDKKEGELPCAVFVPETEPPIILDELRRYLSNDRPAGVCRGAAAQRQRQVRKELLRRWLVGSPLTNEWGRPRRGDRALENRTVGRGRVA